MAGANFLRQRVFEPLLDGTLQRVVKVDYFLPGCPPSADVIWKFLTDLLAGRTPGFPARMVRYD